MNAAKPEPWFFRKVLSQRQTVVFLIAVWFVVSLQSCAVDPYMPDFHFCDDKGSFTSYLELLGHRMKLVSFRENFFWPWLGLHAIAIFVAVKLGARIGLLLAIVLPMLWVFTTVGTVAPGEGC